MLCLLIKKCWNRNKNNISGIFLANLTLKALYFIGIKQIFYNMQIDIFIISFASKISIKFFKNYKYEKRNKEQIDFIPNNFRFK